MKKTDLNFWQFLPNHFTVLAPMDGVTDVVFRQIVAQIGKPDVLFTEFTNCDGLVSAGKEKVMERLMFKINEHPVVAQIWGTNPQTFYESAKLIAKLGFDGIDINMGCPHHDITKDGACSALINNHILTKKIIDATKQGSFGIPVSVKTRLGINSIQIDEWIGFLLEQDLSALTIHLRTVKEMSISQAHWSEMNKIVAIKNKIAPLTKIIGNGDVKTLDEATEKCTIYNCDGIMIGRGIFSNPWLFNSNINLADKTIREKLNLYLRHINLYEQTWGNSKNPANLKKFCKVYINGFANAAGIREKIMQTQNLKEMQKCILAEINA